MNHSDVVSNAVSRYRETVSEAISLAETFTLVPMLSESFNTAALHLQTFERRVDQLRTGYRIDDKRRCAIYVFTLTDDASTASIIDAHGRCGETRGSDGKKSNLCSVNPRFADSATLYIGRSFTPRARIKQHLFASDTGTYAMHLEQWAVPLGLALRLDVYDVPEYKDTPELERAMNVLETGLWDDLKPLLGRRGDR